VLHRLRVVRNRVNDRHYLVLINVALLIRMSMQLSTVGCGRDKVERLLVMYWSLLPDKVSNFCSRDGLPMAFDVDSQPVLVVWQSLEVACNHVRGLRGTLIGVLTPIVDRRLSVFLHISPCVFLTALNGISLQCLDCDTESICFCIVVQCVSLTIRSVSGCW